MNKLVAILLIAVFLISGCIGQTSVEIQNEQSQGEAPGTSQEGLTVLPEGVEDIDTEQEGVADSEMNWRDFELTEVETGDMFSISDFEGQPIVLESMAVWCPTCTRQQREIAKLLAAGDNSVHISLDTDPNEDNDILVTHKVNNGFTWFYAVAPADMTASLKDEFGLTVITAPLAPVILVCPDQSARLLRSGVKSADDLAEEIAAGC